MQQITQQFIERLRHNLSEAIHEQGEVNDHEILAAFDRAALTTVLDGTSQVEAPKANKYAERGKKAAATRKRNAARRREQQGTTCDVRDDGGARGGE